MKSPDISRREFLKYCAVTSTAGLALTVNPFPIKGLAKKKSSKAVMGETEIIRSSCRMCYGRCGILAHVQDGRVVKVEGNPEAPQSKGRLCAKGHAIPQIIYNPARVKYPMKRTKPKGEDPGWVRISWEEATDIISQKFLELREKYGARSIVRSSGTGRDMMWHGFYHGFWQAFGSTTELSPGCICWLACSAVSSEVIGEEIQWCGPDLFNTKCIIAWAKNPFRSFPLTGWFLEEVRERGIPLIVVDPRYTDAARNADVWLPLRPGTDAGLALSMLQVIIEEELYNKEFVEQWSNGPHLVRTDNEMMLRESDLKSDGDPNKHIIWDAGSKSYQIAGTPGITGALLGTYTVEGIECKTAFQFLKDQVQDYTPEKAEEITWVPADRTREAARLYAKNSPGACFMRGEKIEPGINASGTTHAFDILMAITANLDAPGGNLFTPNLGLRPWYGWVPQNPPPLPPEEDQLAPGQFTFYRLGPSVFAPSFQILHTMLNDEPFPLKGMFVQMNNPVLTYDDSKETWEALKRLEFLVINDRFMTPSVELADIVLPAATEYEINRITYNAPSDLMNCLPVVINRSKISEPLWETKDDYDVLAALAPKLGVTAEEWMPFENADGFIEWQLEPLGVTLDDLKEKGFIEPAKVKYDRYKTGELRLGPPFFDGQPGFSTATGVVQIYSEALKAGGNGALPRFIEPPQSFISTPELAKKYPLICMSGARSHYFFHTEYRQIPWLRELHQLPFVEINPTTAAELGIEEGDWVWIENDKGKIRQVAHLTEAIHPKMVMANHGWWYPEKPAPEHGCFDSNINVLGSNDGPYDPATSATQLTGYLCKVYKAKEGAPEGVFTQPEQLEQWLPEKNGG